MDGSPMDWRKGELIGTGAFCSVYLGFNLDSGALMAVKEMMIGNKKSSVDKLVNEIKLLSSLDHPHIVRYTGTNLDDGNLLHIFMEYIPGGSLEDLLNKFGTFPDKTAAVYAKHILYGLHYLHELGILHRDIKGANVLVATDGMAKLADFGASKDISEQNQTMMVGTVTGTPLWMAPEVVLEKGYGRPADIYSVGATVTEMLTGRPPNPQINNFAALVRHWDRKKPVEVPDGLSDEANSFLAATLAVDPYERAGVMALLDHEFLSWLVSEDDVGHPSNLNLNASTASLLSSGSSVGDVPGIPPLGDGNKATTSGGVVLEAPRSGRRVGPAASVPVVSTGSLIRGWTVLVADPDDETRDVSLSVFESLGATVIGVATTQEAVPAIEKCKEDGVAVDLAIIDEAFPQMPNQGFVHTISGLGLALYARVNQQDCRIVFTAESSLHIPSSLARVLNLDAVLSKPISADDLYDALS